MATHFGLRTNNIGSPRLSLCGLAARIMITDPYGNRMGRREGGLHLRMAAPTSRHRYFSCSNRTAPRRLGRLYQPIATLQPCGYRNAPPFAVLPIPSHGHLNTVRSVIACLQRFFCAQVHSGIWSSRINVHLFVLPSQLRSPGRCCMKVEGPDRSALGGYTSHAPCEQLSAVEQAHPNARSCTVHSAKVC